MFGNLDWPLNASRGLSAIAQLLVQFNTRFIAWLRNQRGYIENSRSLKAVKELESTWKVVSIVWTITNKFSTVTHVGMCHPKNIKFKNVTNCSEILHGDQATYVDQRGKIRREVFCHNQIALWQLRHLFAVANFLALISSTFYGNSTGLIILNEGYEAAYCVKAATAWQMLTSGEQ